MKPSKLEQQQRVAAVRRLLRESDALTRLIDSQPERYDLFDREQREQAAGAIDVMLRGSEGMQVSAEAAEYWGLLVAAARAYTRALRCAPGADAAAWDEAFGILTRATAAHRGLLRWAKANVGRSAG